MANKKITELTELTAANIANNDVLAIVDVGGDETKKVAISSLYDIFDNNVTIDTAKIVYGLTGANTNISALSVNTLPLIGGTITGPVVSYSINSSSNVSIAQSLAIGYVDHRVPQANLDVKDNVYIGGATTIAGALTLGTQLAVAQGGTGASSLTDGGVLLGSGTGAITALGVLGDGEVIVGDGTTDPVAESGSTLRTSIGVGTGDSPQFTAVNIGAATDTTVARASAGDINVEGNLIYRAGGTDVPVADGGTGASSLGDGGVLFGSGTSAVTFSPVLTDGVMVVGDGSGDPVLEGNTALRTSIGVGTGDTPQFYGANVSGNASINRSLAIGYTDGRIPQANLEVKGNTYISTDLRVGQDLVVVRDATIGLDLTISGNLTVKGNNFIVHANNLVIDDPIIALAANLKSSQSPADDTGLLLNRGSKSNVFAGYDESSNSYVIAYTPTTANSSPIDIGSYSTTRVGALTADSLTLGSVLTVGQGGTGTTSLTDGGVLLGSGTGAITALGVLGDGEVIVGDGSTDPVAESGDTLRNSIGVGSTASGTVMQVYSANASGNVSINRSLAVGYTDGRVPRANLEVKGNVYISGNVAIAGATNYPEDVKAVFGSQEGGPLQIYHSSGSVSRIEDLSGMSGGLYLRSSSVYLRDAEDDVIISASSTGAFLYHNGNERLKTIPGGIIMSGGLGANVAGNVSVTRSLATGYTDGRVPQANLDVNGNAYISGSVSAGGQTLQGEGDVVALAIALG